MHILYVFFLPFFSFFFLFIISSLKKSMLLVVCIFSCTIHWDRNQSYRICVKNFTNRKLKFDSIGEEKNFSTICIFFILFRIGCWFFFLLLSPLSLSIVHIYRTSFLKYLLFVTFIFFLSHFQLSIFCIRANRKLLQVIQWKTQKIFNKVQQVHIETVKFFLILFALFSIIFQYEFLPELTQYCLYCWVWCNPVGIKL